MDAVITPRASKSETLAKAVLAIRNAQDFVIFLRSLMGAVLAGEVGVKEANAVMIMADRMLKVVKMQQDYNREGEVGEFFDVKQPKQLENR